MQYDAYILQNVERRPLKRFWVKKAHLDAEKLGTNHTNLTTLDRFMRFQPHQGDQDSGCDILFLQYFPWADHTITH